MAALLLIQLADNVFQKAAEEGPKALVLATRVGDLYDILDLWLRLSPLIVNQQMEDISLCKSDFE